MALVRKLLKWVSISVASLLLIAVVTGLVYQYLAQASDIRRWPPSGELVEVDGSLMHIYCQGEGSPTVIVEQGTGGYYDTWQDVNCEMASITRVCAYDRAGAGYSEPVGTSLDSEATADRLFSLLQQAGIDDSLLLVGWSAGGIYVREFYRKYPDKVVGMVLVDSSHEQQRSRLIDPVPPQSSFELSDVAGPLGYLGLIRISGEVDRLVELGPGSEEQKARLKAVQNQSHWAKAYYNEIDTFEQELALNRNPRSLGNLPLIVVSRGREVTQASPSSLYTLEILQENEREWRALQTELVALSSEGVHVIASESGHSVHLGQPNLIVNAVQDIVTQVNGY